MKKNKFNSLFLYFKRSKIFTFLQFFILIFLNEYNRSFLIYLNISKKNILTLSIKQLVLTYLHKFLFKLSLNNSARFNFIFITNNLISLYLNLFLYRLFLLPIC